MKKKKKQGYQKPKKQKYASVNTTERKQKQSTNLKKKSKSQRREQSEKTVNEQRKNFSLTSKNGIITILSVLFITLIVYIPVFDNELTNWDDKGYIIENEVIHDISVDNILELFQRYDMGNYHPLTMISLMLDYSISTKYPAEELNEPPIVDGTWFHVHNVILHLLNTFLVFLFIYKLVYLFRKRVLNRRGISDAPFFVAVITALFFGVNTLHVESVAWVSERKDVLYSFFFMLSLHFYLKNFETRKISNYILSIVFFILSLLSKGQAVSLVITLIAIDFLLQRKWFSAKVLVEKIPYFVLALVFGAVAIMAQKHGEAIHDIKEYPFYFRFLFASYGFLMYLIKMLFPFKLAAIYPYPDIRGGLSAIFLFYPIPVIAIIISFFYIVKRNRQIAFAMLFFAINIFLVLQLLPVGSAIMADRYVYIPSIGFFMLLALLCYQLYKKGKSLKPFVFVIVIGFTMYWGVRTFQQNDIWQNSITLWQSTLKNSERAVVGWNNYGSAIEKLGNKYKKAGDEKKMREYKEESIKLFSKAISLKPDYSHAYYNRGTAKKDIDMFESAIADFDSAIIIEPEFPEAFHNRGIAKESAGDLEGAIADYSRGIELKPELYKLYTSRGVAKGKLGKLEAAIADFNKSIAMQPRNAEAYSNRGFAKVKLNKWKEGIKDYNKALNIKPESTEALYNRAIAMYHLGDTTASLNDYNRLLTIDAKHVDGRYNRGILFFNQKKYEEALADLDIVIQLNPSHLEARNARGKINIRLENWQKVVDDYSYILKVQPKYGLAYYQRGLARIQLGQKQAGCTDLHTSLKLGVAAANVIRKYCGN